MDKRRHKTATEWMWDAIEADEANPRPVEDGRCPFPLKFLSALRVALEGGMSAEQITAFIILIAGLYESLDVMEGEDLVERCREIAHAIKADVWHQERQAALKRRVKEVMARKDSARKRKPM